MIVSRPLQSSACWCPLKVWYFQVLNKGLKVAVYMQEQYVVIEDPTLQQTSTGYNVLMQQLELVSLTRDAVLGNS